MTDRDSSVPRAVDKLHMHGYSWVKVPSTIFETKYQAPAGSAAIGVKPLLVQTVVLLLLLACCQRAASALVWYHANALAALPAC